MESEKISLPGKLSKYEICDLIGSGSYGSVYSAVEKGADADDPASYSAIKIIKIPMNEAEAAAIRGEYPDKEERLKYYQDLVDGTLQEIRLTDSLKDNKHIVSLLDREQEHIEGTEQWTIYTRMELLQPLTDYAAYIEWNEKEVCRLGTDLCDALIACEEKNVIHRDIKPENIMVRSDGTYQLGDFGIARSLSTKTSSLSMKGTFPFMAPEVYKNQQYDARADLYSLGLVLYRLLNNNRPPFADPDKQVLYYKDHEEALIRRMNGEKLPDPVDASPLLGLIIRKACAYRLEDRFKSAAELKKYLTDYLGGKKIRLREPREVLARRKKIKRSLNVVIAVAAAAIIFFAFIIPNNMAAKDYMTVKAEREHIIQLKKAASGHTGTLTEIDYDSTYFDELNASSEASEIVPLIAKAAAADHDDYYDRTADYLIFEYNGVCLGESVDYRVLTDDVQDHSFPVSKYNSYAFQSSENAWEQIDIADVDEEILTRLLIEYAQLDMLKAIQGKRNYSVQDGAYWLGSGSVYEGAACLNPLAIWQNEDGSLDTLVAFRNGRDETVRVSHFVLSIEDEILGTVLAGSGTCDISAPAGSITLGIIHFDAYDVQTGMEKWSNIKIELAEYNDAWDL